MIITYVCRTVGSDYPALHSVHLMSLLRIQFRTEETGKDADAVVVAACSKLNLTQTRKPQYKPGILTFRLSYVLILCP